MVCVCLGWPFVVPILAQTYTDPSSSDIAKESAVIVFKAVHQFGGVVIGEHIDPYINHNMAL
jgi:hypothetical protein